MKNLSENVSGFLTFIITASFLLNTVQLTARLSAVAASEFYTSTEEVNNTNRHDLSLTVSNDDQNSDNYQEISPLQLINTDSFNTISHTYRIILVNRIIFQEVSKNIDVCATLVTN